MAVPFLIIDGYNLIHAAGLARATYGPGDLGRIRLQLLAILSRRMTIEERKRCTVVFDAIDAPSQLSRRFRHQEMLVMFAEPGHEADEVIEQLVAQHSAPRNLTIVSSDHRLQNSIRRRRGTSVDSDVFLKQLESPHRNIGPAGKAIPSSLGSQEDLDFWVKEFEELDPHSIKAELQAESKEPKNSWSDHLDDLQKQLNDSSDLSEWLNEPTQQKRPPRKL